MATRSVRAHFVSRDAEGDDDLDLAEQAERLFRERRVRLRSGYDGFLVVEEDGRVIAAAALAPDEGFQSSEVEFSIATAPDRERRGLARLLVGEVLRFARNWAREREIEHEEIDVSAEVINDVAVPPLLRSLGFTERERGYWGKKIAVY